MNDEMVLQDIEQQLALQPIKGFLADDESRALFMLASQLAAQAPCLEVGSYCGKSTVFIGAACKIRNGFLYAVDHHRGSEEHQCGEEYHDQDLYNPVAAHMDSFPEFRRNLQRFHLDEVVIPVVTHSAIAAKAWGAPLSLVFIDGGHSPEMSLADCLAWSEFIIPNGIMAVHDIYEHPDQGGQGPYLALQALLASGKFRLENKINSLGILRRQAY